MPPFPQDAATSLQKAMAALRGGDAPAAREILEEVLDARPDLTDGWFLMAQAHRALGDGPAEQAALRRVLDVEARDLPSLLMMAEALARGGDDRGAVAYYRTAIGVASQPGQTVQPALVPMLKRGEDFLADANRRFEAHLAAVISPSRPGDPSSRRVAQSIDLLLGRSELFLQQPSMFYFPGLPQRQFYERDEFAWLGAIEDAIPQMRAELEAVMADSDSFLPYVTGDATRPRPNNPLLNDPSWGAFYLWQNGAPVAENAARCPATMAALAGAPIPIIANRSPMALFSLLRPATHIRPHHGVLNTRLICHVPLITAPGCTLRVGNETREWREGQALIFDDSFEHEAMNRGDKTRVVLLFEIWRPELDESERAQLGEIFNAIDTYALGSVDTG